MLHHGPGEVMHQSPPFQPPTSAVSPSDRQLHLQNMREIDNLMNYIDSTDSHHTHTDVPLLTNSTNMPTSPHAHANTVRSAQSSTNSHTATPPLPPYDIRRVLSSNHTRSMPSTDTTSIPSDISTRVYKSSDGVRYLRLNAHVR